MKLTLDANILVRANTRAQGPARELLDLIRSQVSHSLVLSRHILSEVKRTLSYPRLQAQYRLTESDIQEHVDLLQQVSTIIEPVISEPIAEAHAKELMDDNAGIYFDWGPDQQAYHAHVEIRPPKPMPAFIFDPGRPEGDVVQAES